MKPFTCDELFPEGSICIECGAIVAHIITHTTWHNKVADL